MSKIVIVGGGAVGSSIAYFLTSHPKFAGSVTVIERDPTYARASSALSASSIRQQFSTEINIRLSQFGITFLRDYRRHLAVDGDCPELSLREPGYLFLASEKGLGILHANHAEQRRCGADVVLLSPAELKARFPWLSTDGVVEGSLGLSGEGWFDGYGLLQAFRKKARAQGAVYLARDAVGVTRRNGRISGVALDDGSAVEADIVVNAGGPWAARVAAMADIDLPVRARRRMVFVLSCREPLPACPLLVDISGFWMRPEGQHFICGLSPADGEDDPDDLPLDVDETLFTETLWPALAERIPAFEAVKVTGSWAGYYEMNLFDHNGIVGPHPDCANLIFANGFSGHGIQQSPAVGRGIAELIVDGGYRSLDLSPLSFDRIRRGDKLREVNVV